MLHGFVLYRAIFYKILFVIKQVFIHQPGYYTLFTINHLILNASNSFVFQSLTTFKFGKIIQNFTYFITFVFNER